MKKLNFCLSFVLSLFLMFVLLAFQISLVTRSVLLNSSFYINTFEKSDIYKYTYTLIEKKLETLGVTANVPTEYLNNIVDEAWVKEQLDSSTKSTVDYMLYKTDKLYSVNVDGKLDKFNKGFDDYVSKLNLIMDNNTKNEIASIKTDTVNIVKNGVSLIDLTNINKSAMFQKARKSLYHTYSSVNIILIALLINIALLLLLNMNRILSLINWLGYACIAGGLLLLIPSVIGLTSGFMKNIVILDIALKQLIISTVNSSIGLFVRSSILILVVGIALIAISTFFAKLFSKDSLEARV